MIVATPDREHVGPARRFAELGYHVLLEKPIAPTRAECVEVVDAVERAGVILAVCHVMRYTAYTGCGEGSRRWRPARPARRRGAPGAGRLVALRPLVRPGQLAARRTSPGPSC